MTGRFRCTLTSAHGIPPDVWHCGIELSASSVDYLVVEVLAKVQRLSLFRRLLSSVADAARFGKMLWRFGDRSRGRTTWRLEKGRSEVLSLVRVVGTTIHPTVPPATDCVPLVRLSYCVRSVLWVVKETRTRLNHTTHPPWIHLLQTETMIGRGDPPSHHGPSYVYPQCVIISTPQSAFFYI